MKKLVLTALGVIASLNLFAQGTVTFQNSSTTLVMNGLTGVAATSADGIRVALYWAPTTAPDNLSQVGGVATVGSPVAGRFSGGTRTTGTDTPAGSQAWFQVKAWELAYGATYEDAVAAAAQGGRVALRGESNKFLSGTGNPTAVPPIAAVGIATSGLQGFAVNVPEPSVIALGLLGAGALLLLRRRK